MFFNLKILLLIAACFIVGVLVRITKFLLGTSYYMHLATTKVALMLLEEARKTERKNK